MTPPTTGEAQDREAFEKWAETQGIDLKRSELMPHLYWHYTANGAWRGWQARGEYDRTRSITSAPDADYAKLERLYQDALQRLSAAQAECLKLQIKTAHAPAPEAVEKIRHRCERIISKSRLYMTADSEKIAFSVNAARDILALLPTFAAVKRRKGE
ncbi:MAG: hypothetical protein U0800_12705 [Isosphaeraceae bacterium]